MNEYEDNKPTYSPSDPNYDLHIKLDDMERAGMAVTDRWRSMWMTAFRYAW